MHVEAVGSWVNGNNFDNITITGCIKSITVNGHSLPYECSGNTFTKLMEVLIILVGSFGIGIMLIRLLLLRLMVMRTDSIQTSQK